MYKKSIKISDAALIGSWEEVSGYELRTLTKRSDDVEVLDGLIIKGYETKFGSTNENRERYDVGCFDKFVADYFGKSGLNMVVDVQHSRAIDDQVGRVVYMEVNSVGFYFVAYIPRGVKRYEQVKQLLKDGILQGFSKCGWATEYEYKYKSDGSFDYMLIKEMIIQSVSLVTMPANAIGFEAIGETIADRLEYKNKTSKAKKSIYKQNKIN